MKTSSPLRGEKKESVLNYPAYGRGVDPRPDIDTYMLNENLLANSPQVKKKRRNRSLDGETKTSVADNRLRVMSPRRMQYESKFEKFIVKRYLGDDIGEEQVDASESQMFVPPSELEKVLAKISEEEEIIDASNEMLELMEEVFKQAATFYNENFESETGAIDHTLHAFDLNLIFDLIVSNENISELMNEVVRPSSIVSVTVSEE